MRVLGEDAAILTYLDDVYDRGNDLIRAAREIAALSMATTPDFHQCVAKFETLAEALSWDNETKVMKLRAKLSNRILDASTSITPRPDVDDYRVWSKAWSDIANNFHDQEIQKLASSTPDPQPRG
ncbi:uncharacterized protein BROUX77_006365 [Berkeleyomyces rouxiae]|uniref:uncharacterized protein n=1 Tax=Berkeleyomyces rouxiae TaxID=2035830 RepID=UPI003B7CD454